MDPADRIARASRRRSAITKSATTSTTLRRSPTRSSIALLHELERLEARASRPRHARFADPARRRPADRGLRHRRAPRADAQPRQRLQRGGAARVRRARAQGRRARRRAGRLRRRAEDRRPEHRADLRGRPAGARRDARRRRRAARTSPPTSARSARFRCALRGGPPGASRSAARCTCRARRSSGSTASARRPASRCSRTRATPPPARCGIWIRRWSRSAAWRRSRISSCVGRDVADAGDASAPARRTPTTLDGDARLGAAGRAALAALRRHRRGRRVLPDVGRRARRRSSSTPTASSSRSTTWRCASGSARPRSFRAGRPRSSSPRSRRTRAAADRRQRRPHRRGHAVRRARAGVPRRLDHLDGDAAQRRGPRAQGPPRRRHGRRSRRPATSSRGRRADPEPAARRTRSRG